MATAAVMMSAQAIHARTTPRSRAPSSHQLPSMASTTSTAPSGPSSPASSNEATPLQTRRYVTRRNPSTGDISAEPHADLTKRQERAVRLVRWCAGERRGVWIVERERLEQCPQMRPAAAEPHVEAGTDELDARPGPDQVRRQ